MRPNLASGAYTRARIRVLAAATVGVLMQVTLWALGQPTLITLLGGWALGALVWSGLTWILLMPLDGPATAAHVEGVDGGRTADDLIVVISSFMAVLGVGVLLVTGRGSPDVALRNAAVSVAAVIGSWFAVHLNYALRYTRAYYSSAVPNPIEFVGSGKQPPFSDFVYLALDLGMTFQVSDTTTRSPAIRRMITAHTLLSYVLATVVVASTINAVLALAN